MLSVVEHQHPLTPGERMRPMKTSELPPNRGSTSTLKGEARPPVSTEGGLPFKTCPHCLSVFPAALPHFRKDSAKPDGLTCRCTQCLRASDRTRDARIKSKKWRVRHPEYYRQYGSVRYQQHRDKVLATNERWRLKNLDKKRAASQRRYARLQDAPGWNYTTGDHITSRWAMWGRRCYLCGAEAEETDHVIPLSKGGPHWPSNLRPICRTCNRQKGARTLEGYQ